MRGLGNIPQIQIVHSFDELVSTPFSGVTNALCWPRHLMGDFDEVAQKIGEHHGEMVLACQDQLHDLVLSPQGQLARDVLLADQALLESLDLAPSLDCIPAYTSDENDGPISTDVYSFHVDSSTVEVDTYLCSYNVACSEGLTNAEAMRRIDHLETRRELLKEYGGDDDEGFVMFLAENFYDLHYVPSSPLVNPYSFGLGNLWRIATLWPRSPVPPCIHRAPRPDLVSAPRLLLIS